MCGFSVCMHNLGPAWEEYAEYAGGGYCSQVGVHARCFAETLVHTLDLLNMTRMTALRTGSRWWDAEAGTVGFAHD